MRAYDREEPGVAVFAAALALRLLFELVLAFVLREERGERVQAAGRSPDSDAALVVEVENDAVVLVVIEIVDAETCSG